MLKLIWSGTYILEVSEAQRTTLLHLLTRYEDKVIPLYKSSKSAKYRIQHLKNHLGHLRLINLCPHEVSKYRAIRLKTVSPASLKRELVILSRVLTIAERDWGIATPKNLIPLIPLSEVDKGRTSGWENRRKTQPHHKGKNHSLFLRLELGLSLD